VSFEDIERARAKLEKWEALDFEVCLLTNLRSSINAVLPGFVFLDWRAALRLDVSELPAKLINRAALQKGNLPQPTRRNSDRRAVEATVALFRQTGVATGSERVLAKANDERLAVKATRARLTAELAVLPVPPATRCRSPTASPTTSAWPAPNPRETEQTWVGPVLFGRAPTRSTSPLVTVKGCSESRIGFCQTCQKMPQEQVKVTRNSDF
jgi:hypothetical protein